jgi:hypothetical protein
MANQNYTLSNDQRRLIDMYVTQYNQTNNHIERLLDMLDEIRGNIQNIIVSSQTRSSRINRNSRHSNSNSNLNSYVNRLFSDRYLDQTIHYDYASPINPSLYTFQNDIPTNRFNNIFNNFLNTTVAVRPTSEQLQNASRLIRYGDIVNPLSEACPILLERFNENDMVRQIIPCGHLFCQSSFQEWFQNNVRCPVCRYDIRNYRVPTLNNNSNSNSNSNSNNDNTNDDNTNDDVNDHANNNTNHETGNQNPTIDPPLSNINVLRDPETNEVEQVAFDLTNTDIANDLINNLTTRLFQSILSPSSSTNQNNDRYVLDPSNNIFLYETFIRPNRST